MVSPSRWWWCLRVPKNALLVVVIDARESRLSFWLFLSREVRREYSFTQNSKARSSLNSKREETLCATNFSLSDASSSSSSSSSFTSSPRAHASEYSSRLLCKKTNAFAFRQSLLCLLLLLLLLFFFSGLLARLFFSTTRFAFEKERSLQHTYESLSLFCVCVYSTTNDFYTTKREGEEETKRTPPPKNSRCA